MDGPRLLGVVHVGDEVDDREAVLELVEVGAGQGFGAGVLDDAAGGFENLAVDHSGHVFSHVVSFHPSLRVLSGDVDEHVHVRDVDPEASAEGGAAEDLAAGILHGLAQGGARGLYVDGAGGVRDAEGLQHGHGRVDAGRHGASRYGRRHHVGAKAEEAVGLGGHALPDELGEDGSEPRLGEPSHW